MAKIQRPEKVVFFELNEIVAHMVKNHSPRESAVLAGAFVEGILYDMLKLTVAEGTPPVIFEHPQPLSSFGNMASMAFAFGLITKRERDLIKIVKDVRNYASHRLNLGAGNEMTFRNPEVVKMLQTFKPSGPSAHAVAKFYKFESFGEMFDKSPDVVFRLIVVETGMCLFHRRISATRLVAPQDIGKGMEWEDIKLEENG